MAGLRTELSGTQLKLWPAATREEIVQPTVPVDVALRGGTVHFIGIGGIGMSGIARLLQVEGCKVSGCDAAPSEITEGLKQDRIRVDIGHSPLHLAGHVDLVIVSAAIRETNPELREARRRGIPVVKYAQSLGWLMNERNGIAVSGSHGKTTTTSMIAYALSYAGLDPAMLIGGMVPQLGGNARTSRKGPFVVEACEYDRSFLSLSPEVAVMTNIDRDHLDYYTDLNDLVEAFGCFAARVARDGLLVVNGDDPNAVRAASQSRARVETFGEGDSCNWRIGKWHRAQGRTTFEAIHNGRSLGQFEILVPGLYNIRNVLCCMAVCRFYGVAMDHLREAIATFTGARRRFDRLGEAEGVLILDDYGHHPTEIRVTLDAAKQEFPQSPLWCVFQPHQCSRTRILLDEFGHAFRSADRVLVPDIYSVRDTRADRLSIHARDLVREIRNNGVEAEYHPQFPEVVDRLLEGVSQGDVVMTMGAGPVNHVGQSLLVELRKRERTHATVWRS